MKKSLLKIIICGIAASLFFIPELRAEKSDYNLKAEGADTVIGIVTSTLHSGLSRVNSAVIIKDENGKETEFELRPSAVIYNGTDGKLISLKELKAGDRVKVDYLNLNIGRLKAIGIKVLSTEEAPAQRQTAPEEAIK